MLNGKVLSVARVGSTMVLGGTFTVARNDGQSTQITRNHLLAFDLGTNKISTAFDPAPDGDVEVVLPAGDGETVYVGGNFDNVSGVPRDSIARVRVSDGAVVSSFDAGSVTGKVNDLRLTGGRLWMGGNFTHISGHPQRALATLDPVTGAFDTYMRRTVAGVHNGGSSSVAKMDVTPDGRTMVVIGNFDTVDGIKRHQIFQLDLSGPEAAVRDWQTSFFESRCSSSFYSYMHDVDISPDGSFFVVVTTGAYGGSAQPACDSSSRWEIASTGNGLQPSWRDNTGGDTLWSVEVTDDVVYVGGHPRWQNNPFAGDRPGPGAVSREGIAALDPVNGLPLSWDPTRKRGVGVFDFLNTPAGLWVASDTDTIANVYRGRIALMPADGVTFPGVHTPGLPNDLYAVSSSGVQRRASTPTSFGAAQAAPAPQDPSSIRGAFMINGELYVAGADGTFSKRTFDGNGYGPATLVNTQDQITPLAAWAADIKAMTGLFYDNGRLYFTLAGSDTLYYRYFTPQSGVVGAERLVAATGSTAGVPFSSVRGMFLAGDRLYWSTGGDLRRTTWLDRPAAGTPVDGTTVTVSGPRTDGVDWGTPQALFLAQDADGQDVTQQSRPPVAQISSSCTKLACEFDGNGSTSPDAPINSYAWTFGDGATSTSAKISHTYAAPGSYEVTLTVTDTLGRTSTDTASVTVSEARIVAVGAASTNGNRTSHSVAVPTNVQAGDRLLLFMTANSTASTLTGPSGWTLLPGGAQDGDGIRGRAWTKQATASDAGSTVTVTSSGWVKSDLTVSAYRGVGGTLAVSDSAGTIQDQTAGDGYTSPVVSLPAGGASWVVGYWGDKSSKAPSWSPAPGEVVRSSSQGSGGGAVSALTSDGGSPAQGASGGGLTATLSAAASRVTMFSVALSLS